MEGVANDKINYHNAIIKFNEEMIEIKKDIEKGFFLYPYFSDTKIKVVEDINAEKAKSNLTCGLIAIGIVIVYTFVLFKFTFETIMYTIVGLILISYLTKKKR